MFKFLADRSLVKGHLIDEKAYLSPYYQLSFRVKPTGKTSSWGSIIHATVGGDIYRYGDRTPGIWFHGQSTRLHICSAINGNRNSCWNSPFELPLNSFSTIVIKQQLVNGKLLFQVFVNGSVKYSVENKQAEYFPHVNVYGADKWYDPAKAIVTDYKFVDLDFCK